MSDKETFLFSKWPVEVHRRPFRRYMSVYVYPHKPLKVVVAKNTSQKDIVDFLMLKKDWIEKIFSKFAAIQEKFPRKQIKAFETFPFKGNELKLKIVITLNKKHFVSVTEENLLLHIPRNEWSADAVVSEHPAAIKEIRQFYKREAISLLSERVLYWSEQMGLKPSQVKFKEQRTRWGSCSSKKIVNLNWRLIVFSPEIIDYVIVHELAHLAHMNHSNRFWSLVERYVANYKDLVKTLRESQYLVDFLAQNKN